NDFTQLSRPPFTFTITVLDSSKQFAFSFENACTIAERLRYMLLALAWAVAAFFLYPHSIP
ncbi:hypothetical protein NX90_11215, partial [Neisseria meningitidis]